MKETITKIFDHWKQTMNHPRSRLCDKRERAIKKALGWGYSPDDLMLAITGCSKTDFNMGDNDSKQRYDGLELILRNSDNIDRFIGNAEKVEEIPGAGAMAILRGDG